MTDLKKAVVFDEAGFQALKPDLSAKEALAPAQQFQSADFSTTAATPDIETATAKPERHFWWWVGALASLTGIALWQWGTFVAESWQAGVFQGTLVSILTLCGTALFARLGYGQWRLSRKLKQRQQWRQASLRLQQSVQFGEAMPMCQQMYASMDNESFITPLWQQFKQQHKAEFSDAEVLQLFEKTYHQSS